MEKKQYQIYVSVPDEKEGSEAEQVPIDDTVKLLPGNDQETPDKVNKAVM